MDKVQKIREEVARIQAYTQSDVLKEVLDYIDKVQEEPKFKTGDHIKPIDSSLGAPRTILKVCDGWYVTNQGTLDFEFEDNWELAEEPVSEDLDIAIGEYCSNPDNFITYIDVAFAYRSERKDDIPLIIKAIKFGADWQKAKYQETIETAIHHAYHNGRLEMKGQLMSKAVDGDITFDYYGDDDKTYGCIAHNSFCLEDFGLKDTDKVKVIVIKED